MLGVGPPLRPCRLCGAHVAGEQLRLDQVGARELPRHAELHARRQLERRLSPPARLLKVVELAVRERGVVEDGDRAVTELGGNLQHLVPDSQRLFMTTETGERQRFESPAAEQTFGALYLRSPPAGVAGRGDAPRGLRRPPVPA